MKTLEHRDETLDIMRAFAMMWVVLVHVLYWTGIFEDAPYCIIKSFFLFEMPLFFFIAGASNGFASYLGYKDFIIKRCRRILIPYWIYSCVCLFFTLIRCRDTLSVPFVAKVVLSWLIPADRQIATTQYVTWAIWFVPVYLLVMAIFPFLRKLYASSARFFAIPAMVILLIGTEALDIAIFQKVVFYSVWAYVGLFYPVLKDMKSRYEGSLCIMAAGCLCMVGLKNVGYPLNMQSNKFPPNLMFLAYSAVMLNVIWLLAPKIVDGIRKMQKNRIGNLFVNGYKKYSLSIFLYQPFTFRIAVPIVSRIAQRLALNIGGGY